MSTNAAQAVAGTLPPADRAERLILSGNFITSLGNGIQLTASSILLIRAENTAVAVGWLFVAVAMPQALLSVLAGRLADRFDRRTVAVLCDLGSAAVAAALPIWIMMGGSTSTGAYLVNFGLAVMTAVFVPASSALIKERIRPARVGRFNANFEVATQAGFLLSAAIGGIAIQVIGASPLLYFNACTFLVSAVLLYLTGRRIVRTVTATAPAASAPAGHKAPAGSRPPLTRLGLLYAIGNINITVSNTLLVVLVVQGFQQGTGVLGVVDALAGVGMLIAAATYKRLSVRTSNLWIALVGFLGNALIIALEPLHLWVLVAGIPLAGIAFGLARISARTMLMHSVEERRAGAVFGATNAAGLGMSVVVTLIIAQISDHVSITWAFLALAALIAVLPTVLLASLRGPAYAQWTGPINAPAEESVPEEPMTAVATGTPIEAVAVDSGSESMHGERKSS